MALVLLPKRFARLNPNPDATCGAVVHCLQYWGGGVFCAENYEHLPAKVSCLLPQKDGSMLSANCYNADIVPMCTDNGYVDLPFGSGPYIGMGLLVSVSSGLTC